MFFLPNNNLLNQQPPELVVAIANIWENSRIRYLNDEILQSLPVPFQLAQHQLNKTQQFTPHGETDTRDFKIVMRSRAFIYWSDPDLALASG